MNEAAETSALLCMVVRAMVTDRDAVTVKPITTTAATVFEVRVAAKEVGKLIGSQERLAR